MQESPKEMTRREGRMTSALIGAGRDKGVKDRDITNFVKADKIMPKTCIGPRQRGVPVTYEWYKQALGPNLAREMLRNESHWQEIC